MNSTFFHVRDNALSDSNTQFFWRKYLAYNKYKPIPIREILQKN